MTSPLGRLITGKIDHETFVRETNEKRKRNGLRPLAEPDSAETAKNTAKDPE